MLGSKYVSSHHLSTRYHHSLARLPQPPCPVARWKPVIPKPSYRTVRLMLPGWAPNHFLIDNVIRLARVLETIVRRQWRAHADDNFELSS